MMRINLRDVKCKCDACLEAGRIGEEDHIFGQVHIPCMFAPYWERLLDYYSITFVHAPLIVAEEPDDQDPLKGTLCFECSEAIVSVSPFNFFYSYTSAYTIQQLDSATDVWKDVAYGRAIGLDNVPHAQNVQRRNLKHLFRFLFLFYFIVYDYLQISQLHRGLQGLPAHAGAVQLLLLGAHALCLAGFLKGELRHLERPESLLQLHIIIILDSAR